MSSAERLRTSPRGLGRRARELKGPMQQEPCTASNGRRRSSSVDRPQPLGRRRGRTIRLDLRGGRTDLGTQTGCTARSKRGPTIACGASISGRRRTVKPLSSRSAKTRCAAGGVVGSIFGWVDRRWRCATVVSRSPAGDGHRAFLGAICGDGADASDRRPHHRHEVEALAGPIQRGDIVVFRQSAEPDTCGAAGANAAGPRAAGDRHARSDHLVGRRHHLRRR